MASVAALCQAELDGVVVVARSEPGETRSMTQARAWEIARGVLRRSADSGAFDRGACEADARRRVLAAHLGCSYDISLWNQ